MSGLKAYFEKFRGGQRKPPKQTFSEILWSAVGAFLGIFAVYEVGHLEQLHVQDSLFLIGSFGASAILIYGAPRSPFAQPRNLVFGHTLSAVAGVLCAIILGDYPAIAGAMAVSLSLAVMLLTNTVHPPGGATALIAVIGGDTIHRMKFSYVLSPIFTGVMVMLIVALLFNNLSPARRYPEYW